MFLAVYSQAYFCTKVYGHLVLRFTANDNPQCQTNFTLETEPQILEELKCPKRLGLTCSGKRQFHKETKGDSVRFRAVSSLHVITVKMKFKKDPKLALQLAEGRRNMTELEFHGLKIHSIPYLL